MNMDEAVALFVKLARESTADSDQAEEVEHQDDPADLLDQFNLSGDD